MSKFLSPRDVIFNNKSEQDKLGIVLTTPSAAMQIFTTSLDGFVKRPLFFLVSKDDIDIFSVVSSRAHISQLICLISFLLTNPEIYSTTLVVYKELHY